MAKKELKKLLETFKKEYKKLKELEARKKWKELLETYLEMILNNQWWWEDKSYSRSWGGREENRSYWIGNITAPVYHWRWYGSNHMPDEEWEDEEIDIQEVIDYLQQVIEEGQPIGIGEYYSNDNENGSREEGEEGILYPEDIEEVLEKFLKENIEKIKKKKAEKNN